MIALTFCIIFGCLGLLGLLFLGLPLLMLAAVLPHVLVIAGAVLTFKALLDKPVKIENFYPAAACMVMAALLRWII